MDKRCDQCVYWQPRPLEDIYSPIDKKSYPAGQCRIGPPELDNSTGRGRWPLTCANEYCHAFHPKGE